MKNFKIIVMNYGYKVSGKILKHTDKFGKYVGRDLFSLFFP